MTKFASEVEAQKEVRRRNAELGSQGIHDHFWLEVQSASGEWGIEQKPSTPERLSLRGAAKASLAEVLNPFNWLR